MYNEGRVGQGFVSYNEGRYGQEVVSYNEARYGQGFVSYNDREFGQGVVSYNEGGFNSGNHLIQLWQVLVRVWSHTMMAAFGQCVVSQNAGSF